MRLRLLIAATGVALLTGCSAEGPTVSAPTVGDGTPTTPTSGQEPQSAAPSPSPTSASTSAPSAHTPSTSTTSTTPPTSTSTDATLADSRWSGTTSLGSSMTVHLRPDGQFDYTTDGRARDTTPGNDAWRQEGTRLILQPNNAFATYTGTVVGQTYSGTATNVRGKTWTFTLRRTS